MNNYFFLLLSSILFFGCQQTYQYKGDFPTVDYVRTFPDSGFVSAETVAQRNRIYINIDSNNQILLNNHALKKQELHAAFQFALDNPKQLNHLPESWEDAVIFLHFKSYSPPYDTSFVKIKQHVDSTILLTLMEKIFWSKKQKLLPPIDQLSEEDTYWLADKLMPFMAVYHPSWKNINKNIKVKLPSWADESHVIGELKQRNILHVLVNKNDSIFVNDQSFKLKDITELAMEFIANPNKKDIYAENPKYAIISLKNDRETSYDFYIQVYNALKTAYTKLWETMAQEQFGQPYELLNKTQQMEICKQIPLVISEAESDFGE